MAWFLKKPDQIYPRNGHPLNRGLISAWLFTERGGNSFNDPIGKNFAPWTSPNTRNIGRASSFSLAMNGTIGYCTISRVPKLGTGDFSIFAWVNKANTSNRKGVVSYGNTTTNNGVNLYINATDHVAFDLSGVGGPSSTNTVGADVWSLIGATCRNGTVQCYLNLLPDGSSQAMSPNITDPGSNWGNIGRDFFPAVFGGLIDEVRIWGRALNPNEVQMLYYSDYSEFKPVSFVGLNSVASSSAVSNSAVSIIT